jgi:hypothetical protein
MRLRNACLWTVLLCGGGGCTFNVRAADPSSTIIVVDMAMSDLASPSSSDLASPSPSDLAVLPDLANPACTHIDESFLSDPSARWAFDGAAVYDANAKALQINPALAVGSAGSAFFRTKTHMPAVDARFTFYMGDGSGADGMALVFAKADDVTDLVPFGDGERDDGFGLGYLGMNGFALELDTFKNLNNADPNDNHVALVVTASGTHFLSGSPSGAKLGNGTQRKAHLRFDGKHALVEIDDKIVIDSDFPSTIVFKPDDYFIGFTAAGGGLPDRHRVHALSIVIGPADVCF